MAAARLGPVQHRVVLRQALQVLSPERVQLQLLVRQLEMVRQGVMQARSPELEQWLL